MSYGYDDDPVREIDHMVSSYRWRMRQEATDEPCDCLLSSLEEAPGIGPHTRKEHAMESCGGAGMPEPCGGCYDCMIAQWEYGERMRKRAEAAGAP